MQMATREHIDQQIAAYTSETNTKISSIEKKVDNLSANTDVHSNRLDYLESQLESLKQDRLKNNICVSGVPVELFETMNFSEIMIRIASKLGVDINYSHFSAHHVPNKRFIIASFFNYKHKQTIINKIRVKRSLMVVEVFSHASNSQIYLSDHLTPYTTRLFLIARNAKKEGKLATATSYGGVIRVRKNQNDAPTAVTNEAQLYDIIDMEQINSNLENSIHSVTDEHDIGQQSTKTSNKPGPKSKTTKTDKSNTNRDNNKPKDLKRRLAGVDNNYPPKRTK